MSAVPVPPRRWLSVTALLVPAALTLMSVTSVNVALPSIRAGLEAGVVAQSLVLTSYALVFALALLPGGRWGDRFGHKRVFIAGVALFTVATAWCGLAPDVVQLVIARALSGIGASLTMTPVTSIIQLLYKGPERARPFGVMGAVFGVSSAAGPMLAGLLVELGGEFGWRLLFLVNVPFGVVSLALAIFVLPATRPRGVHGGDSVGLLLFTLGLIATMLPFSLGTGLTPVTIAVLVLGIALLVAFALWERRRERAGAFAIVPVRLFTQRALPIGVVTTFLGFAGFVGAFLVLPLLWQDALGRDALAAGLIVLPLAAGSAVSPMFAPALTQRFGSHVVTAGLTMIAVGMAAVAACLMALPVEALTEWVLLAPLLVAGFGVGLFVGPNTNASFDQTDPAHAGVASALVMAAQRCGSAVGLGLLSMLYAAYPTGPADLDAQVMAGLVTAAFAGLAVFVMIVSRRAKLDAELAGR